VASQFHPEFKSRPERPHPLFNGFVASAIAVRDGRAPQLATQSQSSERTASATDAPSPSAASSTASLPA
jgi:CTP synthase